ncbi:hypothetical protein C0J52_16055 [Blattella germanica]|nr:hypothetical protein C0J52_16055 [Blattella germanica]
MSSESQFNISNQLLGLHTNLKNCKRKPGSTSNEQEYFVEDNEDIDDISNETDSLGKDKKSLQKNSTSKISGKEPNTIISTSLPADNMIEDNEIKILKVFDSHMVKSIQNEDALQKVSSVNILKVDSTYLTNTPLKCSDSNTFHSECCQEMNEFTDTLSTSKCDNNDSFRPEDKIQYLKLLQSFGTTLSQKFDKFNDVSLVETEHSSGFQETHGIPANKCTRKLSVESSKSKVGKHRTRRQLQSSSKFDDTDVVESNVSRLCEKSKLKHKINKENSNRTVEIKRELSSGNNKKYNEKSQIKVSDSLENYDSGDTSFEDVSVTCKVKLQLPMLTRDMQKVIDNALIPEPRSEKLVEAFGMTITRRDMRTLSGLNWLNDEVINFYMELLKERGKLENYPSVYCFNSFFYTKLVTGGGHSSVRRWTRKVDIFSYDLIIIPIHLDVHWCLIAIDFEKRTVKYYDSMGSPNNKCLECIIKYLKAECLDKKKTHFNLSGWLIENVKDLPQQMNGSDCGVFSCTYAEFICRNADIVFTQYDMSFFRRKMVYEISVCELIM